MAMIDGMKIALPSKSIRPRAISHVGLRVYLTLKKRTTTSSERPENGQVEIEDPSPFDLSQGSSNNGSHGGTDGGSG